MANQVIILRDNRGRIIGKVHHESNGDKMLIDDKGYILGKYKKVGNVTIDFYGRIVGYGDVLTSLLR